MKLVVVGGHSRNIGKTSVAAGLIAATQELEWTALKITQYGHQRCAQDGKRCDCAPENPEHPYAIAREENRAGGSDTSRFLAAGARDVWWVRTAVGGLAEAMPAIRGLIEGSRYVLVESNSLLRFLQPDIYLMVLHRGTTDFKDSAREALSQADAFVEVDRRRLPPAWQDVAEAELAGRPVFQVRPPAWVTRDMVAFVRRRLATDRALS